MFIMKLRIVVKFIVGCGIVDGWGDYEHLKTVLKELQKYGISKQSIAVYLNFIQPNKKRDERISQDLQAQNITFTKDNINNYFANNPILKDKDIIFIDVSYPSGLLEEKCIREGKTKQFTFYQLCFDSSKEFFCFGFSKDSWGIPITSPLLLEQSKRPDPYYVPVYLKKTGNFLSDKELNAGALFIVTSFSKNKEANKFLLPKDIFDFSHDGLGIEEDKAGELKEKQKKYAQSTMRLKIIEAAKDFDVSISKVQFITQPVADKEREDHTIYIIYYYAPDNEYKQSFLNGCLVSGDNTIASAFSLCERSLPFFQASAGCITTVINEIAALCKSLALEDLQRYILLCKVISTYDKIDDKYIKEYIGFFKENDKYQRLLEQWNKLRKHVTDNLNFQQIFKNNLIDYLGLKVVTAVPSSDDLSKTSSFK